VPIWGGAGHSQHPDHAASMPLRGRCCRIQGDGTAVSTTNGKPAQARRRRRNQLKRQKIKLLTPAQGSPNKLQRQQRRKQPLLQKEWIEQAQSITRLRSRMVKSHRRKAPTKSKPNFRENHANLLKRDPNCPTLWHPLSRGFTRGSTNMDGVGTIVIMGLNIMSLNIRGLPNIMGLP
jgi:hypothetical protein